MIYNPLDIFVQYIWSLNFKKYIKTAFTNSFLNRNKYLYNLCNKFPEDHRNETTNCFKQIVHAKANSNI